MKVICSYCNSEAEYVDSSKVYGKSYGMMYLCKNFPECDSYVGVHKGTDKPFGVMANKELRKKRNAAHKHFDCLWLKKGKGKLSIRNKAYNWLAKGMGIPVTECHIGMFDKEQCKKVIELVKEAL